MTRTTTQYCTPARLNLVDGGWIYTPLLGHFGATAAAAHILKADAKTMGHAFGIAYSLACGNHQASREGASTKHAQPGFAAHNGVHAALMASHGLDGVNEVFCGKDGMARVYLHEQFDAARAIRDLGTTFETEHLSFKPYPTCRLTHPAASAALALRARLGARAHEVSALELEIGPQAWDVVGRPEPSRIVPTAKVTAQFSAYWTVAVAWAYGEVNPLHVFSEVPPTAAVRQWLPRITCKPYPNANTRDIGGCTLRASGPFGIETITVDCAKGHPDNPFTEAEVSSKFASNVKLAGWRNAQAHDFSSYILPMNLPARAGTRRSLLPPGEGLGRAQRGGRRREETPGSWSQFATRVPWRLSLDRQPDLALLFGQLAAPIARHNQ